METVVPIYLGDFDGTMVTVRTPPPPPPIGNLRWWEDSDEVLSSVPTEYDVIEMFYSTSYGSRVQCHRSIFESGDG